MSDDANRCLHGGAEDECIYCEVNAADAEITRLREALAKAREALETIAWHTTHHIQAVERARAALSTLPSPVSETGTGMAAQLGAVQGERDAMRDALQVIADQLGCCDRCVAVARAALLVEPPRGTT